MAFLKFAKASVVELSVTPDSWIEFRSKSLTTAFGRHKASSVLHVFDPNQYMLSHATIMASVDVEDGPGPTGRKMVDGLQIDRRFLDYYITPESSRFVNNNGDSWSRRTLLSSFHTFIGAENFCEHLQIPELSKGKIVDAAARDIGDSVYIDILVATDRKHKPLIKAIKSGQLQTLSMGCFLPGAPVTMSDGRRIPIEEVAPGDMVLTHKGRPREVLNKQVRIGRWSMRRISVVGIPDSIEATGNHPFFVFRPARTCACGCGGVLQTGDSNSVRRMTKRFRPGHQARVLNSNGAYSMEEARQRRDHLKEIQSLKVEQVCAEDLVVGDYVFFPKLKVSSKEDPGLAKARLLGYFLAEGSFLKRGGQLVEVQFNFSLAEKHTFVAETVTLLQDAFQNCAPWVQDREERNTCVVHVTGPEVVAWFHKHGGEYSHLKRLSPEALTWSVETHRNIFGAWLNGDGHRRADGTSVGTTTSYDLACQLHLLAVRCGIAVRIECVFGGASSSVTAAVVNGVSRRHIETGKLAFFKLVCPQSSHDALSGVTCKAPKSWKHNRHFSVLDDVVIFPITHIEKFEYEGLVHNMEVEEDNSYQVHGIATHNCQVSHTQCTKCGNVAEDETQLCTHVRFQKRNNFLDSLGKQRIIAELCGHWSEPGSVKFIEASWVANPAFTGAVVRNILTPEEVAALGNRIQVAFSGGPRVDNPKSMSRAAKFSPNGAFDFGDQGGGDEAPAEAPAEADPMDKAVSEMADYIREKAIDKVRQEMSKSLPPRADLDENRNETLIKEALQNSPEWRKLAKVVHTSTNDLSRTKKLVLGLLLYRNGGWKAVQAASFTGTNILALSRLLDRFNSIPKMAGEARVYRTIVAVGGVSPYSNEESYLAACRRVIGRELTGTEKDALLAKGRLYDLGA